MSQDYNPPVAIPPSLRKLSTYSIDPKIVELNNKKIDLAFKLSWIVNICLFILKIYAYFKSKSESILASLADSLVDLLSQCIISYTLYIISKPDIKFPIGKSRLEAIGVIGCACIMSITSVEVIRSSIESLYYGFNKNELPELDLSTLALSILIIGTVAKLALYFYTKPLAEISDSIAALVEDHINDVMSNTGSIICVSISAFVPDQKAWWLDGFGGVFISTWIIIRWIGVVGEQVDKLVGHVAPDEFIEKVQKSILKYDPTIVVDVVRAYYFGSRFNVEIEIILPQETDLKHSHDLALGLQMKIEKWEEVERCFVHTDYASRDTPEHKAEREIFEATPKAGEGLLNKEQVYEV